MELHNNHVGHSHGNEHHHEHHHEHHFDGSQKMRTTFIVAIILNLAFVFAESGIGLWQNSLSLISDAGHNLSDVLSLALVLFAFHLAGKHSNSNYTYGYKKSTILVSLLNAIILLIAVGAIIAESIHKFIQPAELNGAAISWTAFVGIIINGITTIMLMKGQKDDLNVRGAFLHMAADTLVSIGVVISGIIIIFTGWTIIDPLISIIIAIVILITTWQLLISSLRLSLDGVPQNIKPDEILDAIKRQQHVSDVHHMHIWAISTKENALTAHIVIDNQHEDDDAIRVNIKNELKQHGITHATIEIETLNSQCSDSKCC